MSKYITKFNSTGICELDINQVIKDWNDEKWCLMQHIDYRTEEKTFRLFKRDLRSRELLSLKVEVDKETAEKLIKELALVETRSSIFRLSSTWRKTYGER